MSIFRNRTDYFQNAFWRVENTIDKEGKPSPADDRHLQMGDTMDVYKHLYPVASESKIAVILRNYMNESQASMAAARIAGTMNDSLYVLNIHVARDHSTAPFSANEYLRDENVVMVDSPFNSIVTPKMCLRFHDDVDRTSRLAAGAGSDKKLYIVLLRDDVNNILWTEEKAQALRDTRFSESVIQSLSEKPLTAFWQIETVSESARIMDIKRGIPDDAYGVSSGTM